MNKDISCLSCHHNLFDTGIIEYLSAGTFVKCSQCQSYYMMSKDIDPETQVEFVYLVPVKLSQDAFYKNFYGKTNTSFTKEESIQLKEKIQQAKTPKEFITILQEDGEQK